MASYTVKTGTTYQFQSIKPKLVRDSDGVLHCVFYNGGIHHAYSSNGGVDWTDEVIADGSTYTKARMCMVIDSSDNLHVVWQGYNATYPTEEQIFYRKYTHSTATWETEERITSIPEDSMLSVNEPAIGIGANGNIHVAWVQYQDYSDSNFSVYYSKRTTSWSTPAVIAGDGTYEHNCVSVIVDASNNVYVFYAGCDATYSAQTQVKYVKYTTSWGSVVTLTGDATNRYIYPSVAIDSLGHIHVIAIHYWCGVTYIVYDGSSWSTPTDIYAYTTYLQNWGCIALDEADNLYVTWAGKGPGNIYTSNIYQIKCTGGSWGSVSMIVSVYNRNNQEGSLCYSNQNENSVPSSGFCFVYTDWATPSDWKGNIQFYISDDCFQPPYVSRIMML